MSTIGKRVIYVGPAGDNSCKPLNVESLAKAAIAPGTTLSQSSTGFAASAVAKTVIGEQWLVADKDQMRSKSVDDAWTINENMVAIRPRSGELINALVVTAQALVVGTKLTRNGAGLLVIHTGVATEDIVAHAAEEVTTAATQLVLVTPA